MIALPNSQLTTAGLTRWLCGKLHITLISTPVMSSKSGSRQHIGFIENMSWYDLDTWRRHKTLTFAPVEIMVLPIKRCHITGCSVCVHTYVNKTNPLCYTLNKQKKWIFGWCCARLSKGAVVIQCPTVQLKYIHIFKRIHLTMQGILTGCCSIRITE